MKKLNTVVIIYFLIGLPMMILTLFIDSHSAFYQQGQAGLWSWLNPLLGNAIGVWLIVTFYLGAALIFSQKFREELISRIVHLKQRDEREVISAGAAAKRTFFMSIAIISFLLVISLLHIQIDKIPENLVKADGHRHTLKMGLGFNFWNSSEGASTDPNQTFDFKLPLNTSGILLFLLVVELGSFRWYSKKSLQPES